MKNVLFYTGLAFAGVNGSGDGEDDGFLSAAEVLGLDLSSVRLAVLSACGTAEGDVCRFEGKFSLERAFFTAGVDSYVGSLWSVDDENTSEFMGRFYQHLRNGKKTSEALRAAKLFFLNAREKPDRIQDAGERPSGERGPRKIEKKGKTAHPYYWAPFVLSGADTAIPFRGGAAPR